MTKPLSPPWLCACTCVQDTKCSITKMLSEYLDSHDVEEAARCLRQLSVPFFHHELVKQALHAAMEQPAQGQSVIGLLQRCAGGGGRGLCPGCIRGGGRGSAAAEVHQCVV